MQIAVYGLNVGQIFNCLATHFPMMLKCHLFVKGDKPEDRRDFNRGRGRGGGRDFGRGRGFNRGRTPPRYTLKKQL